jgi:polyisoprenyl-teichoic acid--peptidoglycan teichoic acid transferase
MSKYTKASTRGVVNSKCRWGLSIVSIVIIAIVIFIGLGVNLGGGLTEDLYAKAEQPNRVAVLRSTAEASVLGEKVSSESDIIEVIGTEEQDQPKVVTFVLYGKDEHGGGTDTVLLGFAELNDMNIHLLSIPRDLSLDLSMEAREELLEVGISPHSNSYGLIANWGRSRNKDINRIITRELSRVFDIPIDYYFSIDTEAFVEVVDLVGPIPFYVKQSMRYHNGERLLVDLKEGQQFLTGRQAEGLVRYRSYRMGDFERTEVQREFIKAFLSHISDRGLSPFKLLGMLQIALNNVETNFTNPIPYIGAVAKLDQIKIHSYLLPLKLENNSWFLYDESFEVIDSILKQVYSIHEQNKEGLEDSQGVIGLIKE